MAGQVYTKFIKDLEGEYNVIEYGGTGGVGAELYLSVKGVLKWISKYPNMFSGTSQILKVDWESDKPMFTYSTVISCNLEKIYIRNDYLGTSKGTIDPKREYIGSFKPITQFNAQRYSNLVQEFKEEANVTVNPSIYPSIGNLNNVYVNVIYLSEILAKKSDNKDNKVTIREFLQTLCDGINKALGSLNDLQVITDVDGAEETLTIIDYQQKRIKNLAKQERPTTTIQAQGLGTMLTSIQAQSSITPEIADMISIGAQAQEQTVGEEATSFSLLSKGLKDKIYPTKKIGEKTILEEKEKEKALKAINERFKTAISTYTALVNNQQATDKYGPIKIASTDQSNKDNIAVELYKACLGKFTQTGQTSTAFIPIKLDLSLYGLGGIKIYQKFKLSNDVLPLSYKDNFEFIILGISHTVNATKWETSISSLISLKDEKIEKESKTLAPFAIPLETVSGASSPISASPGGSQPAGYDTSKIRRQTISGLFVANGEVPDKYMLELNNSPKYKGDLSSDGGRIRLLKPIMLQLEKLLQAYENDNPYTPIKINSAYRLYEDQVRVRKIWEAKGKANNAAYPGRSNHGFGRAVDFADVNLSKLTPSMRQYKWLKKNAGKYGFTRISRPGKPETWEAWHWEYLGDVGSIF